MSTNDPYQDLIDESRHREALEERARERWLRAQLREDARFTGALTDLVEQRVVASVRSVSGATYQGWLLHVAADHVVIELTDRHHVYVVLEAVTDVRPEPTVRQDAAGGDRGPAIDRTLREVLARLVDERPRVHVRVEGQRDGVTGQLRGVGADVLSVRLDGGGTAYVSLPRVTELALVE